MKRFEFLALSCSVHDGDKRSGFVVLLSPIPNLLLSFTGGIVFVFHM